MINLDSVGLEHPRGGATLLSGASLQVSPGEVVLVVGAAGVGTSRLVTAVLGETAIAAGRIEVLGRDVSKLRRSSLRLLRRTIGIVPQDLCLLDDRSAQLNVMMPLEIDGIPRSVSELRAADVLDQLALEADAHVRVDALPPSVRQRVAVARALIREPEIVIADHPTSMQDAMGADLVCTALEAAARRGAACLVLGREPMLRTIADLYGWRVLGLVGGTFKPMNEIELDGQTIDDVLVGVESAPVIAATSEPLDNVIPFRQAGAR